MRSDAARQRGRRRPQTFAEIVCLWPTYDELAQDVGVAYPTVASWRRRSSIPPRWWGAIVQSAQRRRITGITFDTLRAIDDHNRCATAISTTPGETTSLVYASKHAPCIARNCTIPSKTKPLRK